MAFVGTWEPPLVPGENRVLSIDFGLELAGAVAAIDAIASVTSAISVVFGFIPDPNAANWLVGPPFFSGTVVSQELEGAFVPKAVYRLTFAVTMTSGLVFINDGHVACIR